MAKLSPETKAMMSARRAAYKVRYDAWQKAKELAIAPFATRAEDATQGVALNAITQEYLEAEAACTKAENARDEEAKEIQKQIDALTQKRNSLGEKYQISELHAVRRQLNNQWNAERRAAEDAVDAEYPDVAGVFSEVEWAAKTGWNYEPKA